jgi:hypothetical protein
MKNVCIFRQNRTGKGFDTWLPRKPLQASISATIAQSRTSPMAGQIFLKCLWNADCSGFMIKSSGQKKFCRN